MGFIPNEIIRQVLDRCDIADLIASYIPLKRSGHNFKALCPFHHEKTPSFVVNPQKQIYHCFGCGAGGNIISFIMAQEHVEFPEAVKNLAQKAGITIPHQMGNQQEITQHRLQLFNVNELAKDFFHHNLLFGKDRTIHEVRTYLNQRGLDVESVKRFQIGFALEKWDGLLDFLKSKNISLNLIEKTGLIVGKNKADGFYDRFRNRIIFPILDVKGRCIAFGGRALEKGHPAKYINSPETPLYTKGQHLYGLYLAKDEIIRQDNVIIVEGYMDFITPFQAGVRNVVASLGTALTLEQIRLIRRYTNNIVMLFDSDQAGEAAMIRSLDLLIEESMNVKVATLSKGHDPDSFIKEYGKERFQDQVKQALTLFDFKLKTLLSKYSLETVEDRGIISTEMLPTISRFQNEVIKSEYIKKLAGILSVAQEALMAEMKRMIKLGHPQRQSDSSVSKAVEPRGPLPVVEKNILRLMLEERDYIPLTQKEVQPEDFGNEYIRMIVAKVFELFNLGKETISSVELTSYFNDQTIIRVISELMAAEDLLSGDRRKIHSDCIRRLKQNQLKAKRQMLSKELGTAQADKDHPKIEELMKQLNQLIKG